MSQKKPPPPAVASTGCSGLMSSCLSLHRRRGNGNVDDAPPRPGRGASGCGDPAAAEAEAEAEQYWKRVRLLEEEVRRLGKRLGQDDAERGRTRSKQASCGATTSTRRVAVGQGASVDAVQEMVRLEDGGGYLHEIRRVAVGMPWRRLALQVSPPVVPENAARAPEVLDKMTETRAEDLCKSLAKMMPIKDIAGGKNPSNVIRRPARLNSGDDFLEALLFKAMDKMEALVLEGLKIQMAQATDSAAITAAGDGDGDQRNEAAAGSRDCMVYVVLIQVRDPEEGYAAIGDPMIGLMEAALQRRDGKVKLEMQGMHVAGILFGASKKRTSNGGGATMWSACSRQCKKGSRNGGAGGDGCRCSYVRNPNRVFHL